MKIIDVFICKLRKKLALANAADLIFTVWGRGYMIRETTIEPTHHYAEAAPVHTNDPVAALADA